jgi:hypothetical protein
LKSFFNAASDALAQATDKRKVPDGPDDKQKPPADNGLDVRFVPADFYAGAVVNGPSVLKAPLVTSAVPEEVIGPLSKTAGLDPHKVERVVVLLGVKPGAPDEFTIGVVVRFSEAVDGKAVLGAWLKGAREVSAEGLSYSVSQTEKLDKLPAAGHVADARTVLYAPEPTLRTMLAAKPGGALAAELKRVDLKADVSAAFVMGPAKSQVAKGLAQVKNKLPPEFADVATLPERLKSARLALRLEGETLLTITLEAENDDSAAVLEKLLGQGHGLLKQRYPALRKDLAKSLPPDLSQPVLGVVDQVPNSIGFVREGKVVTATLKTPQGLAALGPKLTPLLLGGRPAGEWKTFTDREQGFSVNFPGEPKKTVKKAPGGDTTSFEAMDGLTAYTVLCNDFPNDMTATANLIFDTVAKQFGASLKSQGDVKIKSYPGKELVIEMENMGVQLVITDRAYVVKKRMYQVMVATPRSKHDPAQARKFLDSFALLEDGSPVKPADPGTGPVVGKRTESGASLKGDTKAVMDVSVTTTKLPPKTTLPCLTWADDKGSAFYALDTSGLLRRVSYPDLKEEWKQDLGEKCAWLSLSSEGLLVTPAGGKEVWLIDPAKGGMKGRFTLPDVKRAVSAPGAAVGVASAGDTLYVLDLKKMTSTKFDGKSKFGLSDNLAMAPDGKHVFTAGPFEINRFTLADGQLRLEESTDKTLVPVTGRIDTTVIVSPDSKFVCYPSFGGAVGPGTKNYTVPVFKVDSLAKPEFVLDPGGTAVGFDPAGGAIYTQNSPESLRLFDSAGKFIKECKLREGGPTPGSMRQMLPHPGGGTLLLTTTEYAWLVTASKK